MRKTLKIIYVLGMAAGGAALTGAMAGPYIKYDDVKGEVSANAQGKAGAADKKVKSKSKPQKGLLLPAVQKTREVTPSTPPPSPRTGGPTVAAGDLNGDGMADKVGAKPEKSRKRKNGALNQIRTNE